MSKKPKDIMRECKHHGRTTWTLENNGTRYRCKACRVEAVQRRRDKIKAMAIEYKGSKCQNKKCGYNKCSAALEFHHRDPATKEFSISSGGYTRSWERVKKELDKCDLLCANCHREVEAGL